MPIYLFLRTFRAPGLVGKCRCSVEIVEKVYIWLNLEYPAIELLECQECHAKFAIRRLKSELINNLVNCGEKDATQSLRNIFEQFPCDEWLRDCIVQSQIAEQEKNISIVVASDLKKLCELKGMSYFLVNNSGDLLSLILEKLDEYEQYLQGDNPAVGDLWNTRAPIQPQDEEYLSDHLARFLKLKFTAGIVINREVQISRKLFSGGKSGSRTDIWVQASDDDGRVLTLCIEVKGNWNDTAKTALKKQLVDKYMSGGTATAGVFLVGWYSCKDWATSDNRKAKSTRQWANSEIAKEELEKQACSEKEDGRFLAARVINCSLE